MDIMGTINLDHFKYKCGSSLNFIMARTPVYYRGGYVSANGQQALRSEPGIMLINDIAMSI